MYFGIKKVGEGEEKKEEEIAVEIEYSKLLGEKKFSFQSFSFL